MTLNGALAGMVIIIIIVIVATVFIIIFITSKRQVSLCAGCNVYEPWAALVVGAGGGFCFLAVHTLMLK